MWAIETALHAAHGGETATDKVLRTMLLIKVEVLYSMQTAKPLGNVSTDESDPDPVMPNIIRMGWLDVSLPQVGFCDIDLPDDLGVYPHSHFISQVVFSPA